MFLVFYSVLTIYISQGNCFNVKRDNNGAITSTNGIRKKLYSRTCILSNLHYFILIVFSDTELNNRTTTSNYNNFLSIILNTKRATNLKSNIFDKMLSNEMYSIKQHLFEKDLISSVYMSFKNNVVTPTLEINQKWPIEKVHEVNMKPKLENTSTDKPTSNGVHYNPLIRSETTEIKKYERQKYNLNMQAESSKKVLEVRSFSVIPNHNPASISYMQQQPTRQCTCVKCNQNKLCSHSKNGILNTEKICTHTENDLTLVPACTRTSEVYSVSLTYFPYYAYPYFVGITTDPFNSYYHPDVVNNLKLTNGKRYKKIKKPYIYEELSKTEESKEGDDDDDDDIDVDEKNLYDYVEDDKSKIKTNESPKHKYNKNSKIFTVNYDKSYVEDSNFPEKIHNGNIKVMNRDKFVEDIIEDLKVYYNDAVIKDCYCSLSSLKNGSTSTLFLVAFIILY